jgi:hypothetical protein
MYLKSILLQHAGPIDDLRIEMPFDGLRPKPLVLVGPNGSGKSTVLSFIVNALISFKQHVFGETEIEQGKVYRIRSPLGIRSGAHFYHSLLKFEHDIQIQEWQLDQTKESFENTLGWTPNENSWSQIPEHDTSHIIQNLGTLSAPHRMEAEFAANCLLFFPADRFEPPDWLNTANLSHELRLPEPSRIKGRTERRIFSRNRLKPTMEWLTSVLLDMLLLEHRPIKLPITPDASSPPTEIIARVAIPGPSTAVFKSIVAVLRQILADNIGDEIQLGVGDRRSRIVSATVSRNGKEIRIIKDLLSLSAGESALFCLFAGIIRDADQAGMSFTSSEDIRGLVLIDEADLHLHLGFQHTVLPRLLALFPNVQFIMTLHSPLVVLGMENIYGLDGFVVLEMPLGTQVNPESYSEFLKAVDVFTKTKTVEAQVLSRINAQPKPALLVEGVSDEILLRTAWGKLNDGVPIPFEIIPCGVEPQPEARAGGAEMLRRCLEFLSIASDRTIVGLFDNDRAGNQQFNGTNRKAFGPGQDPLHRKHVSKAAHALLLPVPSGRELFVTPDDIAQRYLSIEHYFEDTILRDNGIAGAGILGTNVFEITGDKVGFANKTTAFDPKEFAAFRLLFARIESLI